jgi:pimeloyl-ACP methyl ester carboxylesterase
MPKILANGIQIHYQQMGQGPDLVLIHGITGDLSSWYHTVMPALAKEARVLAYDLRGHGYSDVTPTGYTSAHMAADLTGLLDSLGIERAHLVGHSWGATVALHSAVLYPERVAGLVLADPIPPVLVPLFDPKDWPYLEVARAALERRGLMPPEDKRNDMEYLVRRSLTVRNVPFGWRREAERANRRTLRLLNTTSGVAEAQEVAGLTLEAISQIRQPTLCMYGQASRWLSTARHLQERIPRCQVVVLENASHFFALAKPELLVAGVTEFLRGLNGDGASGAPRTP